MHGIGSWGTDRDWKWMGMNYVLIWVFPISVCYAVINIFHTVRGTYIHDMGCHGEGYCLVQHFYLQYHDYTDHILLTHDY